MLCFEGLKGLHGDATTRGGGGGKGLRYKSDEVACVASVSVRPSARSMHFSLFWSRENWGGRKKVRFFALAPIFARLKNKKCLERAENLTETLATQASDEGDRCTF